MMPLLTGEAANGEGEMGVAATATNVARAFEQGLDEVYGKFTSRALGAASRYQISCDETNLLRPVRVLSQCMHTHRQANGLKDEWQDHFFILLQKSGQIRISSDEHSGLLRPNDLMILDGISAYDYLTTRRSESLLAPFAYDFVPDPRTVLAACGQRIDGSNGVGHVLSTTLSAMLATPRPDCDADCQALRGAVSILLRRVVESVPSAPLPPDGDGLMLRLEAYALAHLSDPGLGPDTLSDAVGVSRRQLYRLFAEAGASPGAWLWMLRLREAHTRLVSPNFADQSLTRIAFDVGFNDMAHFSRLYRGHFGVSPRENRRRAFSQD
jgi:AraC-like DNA-binding protein